MISEINLNNYKKNGFTLVEKMFSIDEISFLANEAERLVTFNSPGLVQEGDKKETRSLNGANYLSNMMDEFSKDHRLVSAAQQLLEEKDIYIHQYKINMKRAFTGETWDWHSDFFYWNIEDGMPEPYALTVAILLDDVNDFNSPLLMVPGTQNDILSSEHHVKPYGDLDGGENWHITFSTKLKHELSREHLSKVINKNGIIAAKGLKGTAIFFHCNVLHYSNFNSSPWDRRIIYISYNPISNALKHVASPRPEFLASRNFTPIVSTERSSFINSLIID